MIICRSCFTCLLCFLCRNFVSSSHQSCNVVSPLPLPQMEKLPDASLLFFSSFLSHQSIVTDHSSGIASAIAASDRESRKRESNGSGLAYPHRKLPRGPLPHSRNIPDTVGGQLIPPQLRGRLVCNFLVLPFHLGKPVICTS